MKRLLFKGPAFYLRLDLNSSGAALRDDQTPATKILLYLYICAGHSTSSCSLKYLYQTLHTVRVCEVLNVGAHIHTVHMCVLCVLLPLWLLGSQPSLAVWMHTWTKRAAVINLL